MNEKKSVLEESILDSANQLQAVLEHTNQELNQRYRSLGRVMIDESDSGINSDYVQGRLNYIKDLEVFYKEVDGLLTEFKKMADRIGTQVPSHI